MNDLISCIQIHRTFPSVQIQILVIFIRLEISYLCHIFLYASEGSQLAIMMTLKVMNHIMMMIP